jgi:hypothetical protein
MATLTAVPSCVRQFFAALHEFSFRVVAQVSGIRLILPGDAALAPISWRSSPLGDKLRQRFAFAVAIGGKADMGCCTAHVRF